MPNGGSGPLILDLRDNPGTDVKAGLAAANLFVDTGTLALQQDSGGKETTTPARTGLIEILMGAPRSVYWWGRDGPTSPAICRIPRNCGTEAPSTLKPASHGCNLALALHR